MDETLAGRRPLKSRESGWARRSAAALASAGVTPNAISIASVGFSVVAAAALVGAPYVSAGPRVALYALAIVGIQLRLVCNLLDGMVAIEGGRKSKSGEVYNDLPDRIADPLILVAAGYAAGGVPHGVELGWLAGVLSVMTAYLRVLGRSIGAGVYFIGPMAKQHRMAVLTAACVAAAAVVPFRPWDGWILASALAVICLGCVATLFRRTVRIVRDLEARP